MSIKRCVQEESSVWSSFPTLGPRLFSIFTNDLPNHLDRNIEMFADDSMAYLIGNSIDSIHVQIQKLLGVTLDNKLSWSPHINQISCTFNAKITKLKRMKTFDRPTLESISFKAILPSTTYCISLWGSSHLLSELEDLHIRAARLIHNLSPSIPKHEVLHKANWNSLSYLYKKRLACIAYQAYYEQTPSDIKKLFSKHRTN